MGEKVDFYTTLRTPQSDVTGSENLITVIYPDKREESFLVDFGLYQGSKEQEVKNSEIQLKPQNLCAILLTHAHMDHAGRIPLLYKYGAKCRTFCTKDTMRVSEILLKDAPKVLTSYDESNVEKAMKEFRYCEYGDSIQITSHITAKFLPNSHTAGASMILVTISYPGKKDIVWQFSGDYKSSDKFCGTSKIIDDTSQEISCFLLESTYGGRNREQVSKFRNDIVKNLEKFETFLIPVFSFGRAQRILLELTQMQEEGLLPINVTIYLDGGMAIELTNIWSDLETVKNIKFIPKNLVYVKNRKDVITDKKKKIIVTTAGMGSYGPAREYIPHYINDEYALIYLCGYSSPDSNARKIFEAKHDEYLVVSGILRQKKATVLCTEEFSSHADQSELVALIKSYNKIDTVLLNHGQNEQSQKLGESIYNAMKIKDIGIVDGKTAFKIGPYGLIKTFQI